jgi:chromosome segregation ATPase
MNINNASMLSTAKLRTLEHKFQRPIDMTQALILRGVQAELVERGEERAIAALESELKEKDAELETAERIQEELEGQEKDLRLKIQELERQLGEAGKIAPSSTEKTIQEVLAA